MNRLSHVMDQRPMLRVARRDPARILFCDATNVGRGGSTLFLNEQWSIHA